MDTKFAIFFGTALVGLIILDITVYDSAYLVLWGKQFMRLVEWVAFWR